MNFESFCSISQHPFAQLDSFNRSQIAGYSRYISCLEIENWPPSLLFGTWRIDVVKFRPNSSLAQWEVCNKLSLQAKSLNIVEFLDNIPLCTVSNSLYKDDHDASVDIYSLREICVPTCKHFESCWAYARFNHRGLFTPNLRNWLSLGADKKKNWFCCVQANLFF